MTSTSRRAERVGLYGGSEVEPRETIFRDARNAVDGRPSSFAFLPRGEKLPNDLVVARYLERATRVGLCDEDVAVWQFLDPALCSGEELAWSLILPRGGARRSSGEYLLAFRGGNSKCRTNRFDTGILSNLSGG